MENSISNNIQWLNFPNLFQFLLKFGINIIVVFILVRMIYFRASKNRTYHFTLFVFNLTIFLVCSLLNNLTLSLGFSFGIFALFSILRYRTITIPIKEMTYFFMVICIAIINALANEAVSILELGVINILILLPTYILERIWIKNEMVKLIILEKIELIKPDNHDKLIADLQDRTGLKINRFEIGKVDFLRDTAEIKIYYYDTNGTNFSTDSYQRNGFV
jgi:hypothetical protein